MNIIFWGYPPQALSHFFSAAKKSDQKMPPLLNPDLESVEFQELKFNRILDRDQRRGFMVR